MHPVSPLNIIWQRDLSHNRYWASADPTATTTSVVPREYEWISSLLSAFDVHHHLDGRYEVVAPNPIVVLEGQEYDPDQVQAYLHTLRAQDSTVGILHIGDEFGWAPLEVYDEAAFVYRNYWRPEIDSLAHCHYLPLGVNCPRDLFEQTALSDRPYRWSFAGQAKPSRHAMIETLAQRTDGHLVINDHFNSGLSKPEYATLLSNTQIVLCPRGWASVESYRFYEALEAGAIPLVEDDGGFGLYREHCTRSGSWNALKGGPKYWYDIAKRTRRPSYWRSAFGEDFPCPRIYKWENLPATLDEIDPAPLAATIRNWWTHYKRSLRDHMSASIHTHLHIAHTREAEILP